MGSTNDSVENISTRPLLQCCRLLCTSLGQKLTYAPCGHQAQRLNENYHELFKVNASTMAPSNEWNPITSSTKAKGQPKILGKT